MSIDWYDRCQTIEAQLLLARAEIERLRAMLQQIEHETGETMFATNHGKRGNIAYGLARRALEEKT